jgi:lipopolysaccharide assembly outer membrane protein LptD (OstA)
MRFLFLCIVLLVSTLSFAQPVVGERGKTTLDTLLAQADGVTPRGDSLVPAADTVNITYSKESVDDPVEYNAQDSMIYDIPNQKVYLYGKASVKQKTMEMKAHYIVIDNKTNTVAAEGKLDGKGADKGRCSFKDGEQDIVADRIKFNFKTKKGKIYNTRTKQGENDYVQSEENKFVAKDPSVGRLDDVVYGKNAMLTTCDADEPHFGILSTKQKVVSGKLVVAGVSTLVVGGVPTPVVLPFAFFPITKGRRGGFLMPSNYDLSISRGIGLQGLGWYFPINDNMDLQVRGDIYTRGTWRIGATSNYIKRYASSGSFNINYANNQVGEFGTKEFAGTRDFQLGWTHQQDAKAHPKQRFSASVNLGTATVLKNSYNDAQNVLNNNLSSNINYSRTLSDDGMTFNAGFTHSQNTQNRAMDITLPRMNFSMPAVFPFKKKVPTGKEAWFEKLNFTYSTEAQTRLSTTDTTLFKGDWERLKNQIHSGMTHNIPVSVPLKLKYFNITPSMSYNENWYFTTTRREFDPTYVKETKGGDGKIRRDTGQTTETTRWGFDALRQFNASVAVGTNLYGLLQIPNKGSGLRAIRHAITPSMSFTYSPENRNLQYTDSIRTGDFWRRTRTQYNYMERAPYGFLSNGKQNTIGLSLNNSFQAKSAKRQADSTFLMGQPFNLLNLNVGANYNLAADSLHLSTISPNFNTTLFKFISIYGGATVDPYEDRLVILNKKAADGKAYKENKYVRTNTFRYAADGRLVTFKNLNFSASANFNSDQLREIFGAKPAATTPSPTPTKQQEDKSFIQNMSVAYNLNYSAARTKNGADTLNVISDISVNGTLNLTNNWRFDIGRIGYDLANKRLTYPDFTIYRNLHCWELGMSWQPDRDTYTFFLRAKPGTLDFLKVPYNKNRLDPTPF